MNRILELAGIENNDVSLSKLIVVTNKLSDKDELADIMFVATPVDLAHYFKGMAGDPRTMNIKFYLITDHAAAKRDALSRLSS